MLPPTRLLHLFFYLLFKTLKSKVTLFSSYVVTANKMNTYDIKK